jgi:hypothetical protein
LSGCRYRASLARDRKQKFQDLADEAFFDLLKKHGRQPTKEAGPARDRGLERNVRTSLSL